MNSSGIDRLLDANANRAREGIRTAEDYIRFEIENKHWAERLRALRHQITTVMRSAGFGAELVSARDAEGDCGHPDRQGRLDAEPSGVEGKEIAVRGLKRAQEALRVLEEYGRGRGGEELGRSLGGIRFALYEAERWVVAGSGLFRAMQACRLYVLLTGARCRLGLSRTLEAAIKGGAGAIQLREKELPDREFLARARDLGERCGAAGVPFFVNDRADIALAAGAVGVHLGQEDLSPEAVRCCSGRRLLLGRSTHGVEQALRARDEGADYLAIGAMFPTGSKSRTELVGPEGARAVVALALGIPVFAIGGIDRERIASLRDAGVTRIAVSAAVISAPDPERAAAELREALEQAG